MPLHHHRRRFILLILFRFVTGVEAISGLAV